MSPSSSPRVAHHGHSTVEGTAESHLVWLKYGFLLAILLLFVTRAYFVPVWGSSEAREAHVAEQVVQTGNVILPLRNGLVPSKPPLLHWLSASIITVFGFLGVSISGLWAARIVSACAAVATVWLVARHCERQKDHRNSAAREAAWWMSAGILLTSYGFFSLATDARVDMLLCLLVTGAGVTFLGGLQRIDQALPAEHKTIVRTMQYQVALWCGLAVLAKGPLGIVFPGLIFCAALLSREGKNWRVLIPYPGPVLVLLTLAVPWYLAAAASGGSSFVERQIVFENIARLAGGAGINSKPWYFYGPVFLTIAIPWSLIALLHLGTLRLGSLRAALPQHTYAVIWLAGLLAFSVADGKRGSYLLLILPWLAMHCTTVILHALRSEEFARRVDGALLWLFRVLFVLTVVFTASVIPLREFLGPALFSTLQVLGACMLGWLCFSVLCFNVVFQNTRYFATPVQRVGGRLLVISGLCICIASGGVAVKGALKGYEPISQSILAVVASNEPLYAVRTRADERLDPLFYLLRRPITILDPALVAEKLPTSGYLLADHAWLAARGYSASRYLAQIPLREPQLALVKVTR